MLDGYPPPTFSRNNLAQQSWTHGSRKSPEHLRSSGPLLPENLFPCISLCCVLLLSLSPSSGAIFPDPELPKPFGLYSSRDTYLFSHLFIFTYLFSWLFMYLPPFPSFTESPVRLGTMYSHACLFNVCLFLVLHDTLNSWLTRGSLIHSFQYTFTKCSHTGHCV